MEHKFGGLRFSSTRLTGNNTRLISIAIKHISIGGFSQCEHMRFQHAQFLTVILKYIFLLGVIKCRFSFCYIAIEQVIGIYVAKLMFRHSVDLANVYIFHTYRCVTIYFFIWIYSDQYRSSVCLFYDIICCWIKEKFCDSICIVNVNLSSNFHSISKLHETQTIALNVSAGNGLCKESNKLIWT